MNDNNKIIAEFMGITPNDEGVYHISKYKGYDVENLSYHASWDWLMPVISKITRNESLIENEYRESIMDTVPYGLIEDTYKTVVEFIKNQNK